MSWCALLLVPQTGGAALSQSAAISQVVTAEQGQCGGTAGAHYACAAYPTTIWSSSNGSYWRVQVFWRERWYMVGTIKSCSIAVDVPKSGSSAWSLAQRARC